MSKKVVRLVERDALDMIDLPDGMRLSLFDIAGVAREGLLALSAAAGVAVMNEMMHAELTGRIGAPKHAKTTDRAGNWHASAPGSLVLGGRRVSIERPRGRTLDGHRDPSSECSLALRRVALRRSTSPSAQSSPPGRVRHRRLR